MNVNGILNVALMFLVFPFCCSHAFIIHNNQRSSSPLERVVHKTNLNMIGGFQGVWTAYNQALVTDPYPTKMVTGVVLAIMGDAIAQRRERPAQYNVKRAVSFAAFDGCYRAVQQLTYPPIIATCQGQYIGWLLGLLNIGGSIVTRTTTTSSSSSVFPALEQTLVSQLLIIPTIYYPVFYAVTGLVQGLTLKGTIRRAKETFLLLMKRNMMFWIPIQFLAFGFIQKHLQIPVLILCGLAWTVILSLSAGSAAMSQQQHQQPAAAT